MDQDNKDLNQLRDEQELAKVLAGINNNSESENNDAAASTTTDTSTNSDELLRSFNDLGAEADTETPAEIPNEPPADTSADATPSSKPETTFATPELGNNLETIKQSAINDLRPLVDKLNLPEDEKFSTYLLLIRSTNDSSLIAPAYEVAKLITDETKRAQALLDIVKEIDFFNNPSQ